MIYTDAQITGAINRAPAPVRDKIRSGDMAMLVADMGTERGLHVDTIGHLAAITRDMLIGLSSPADAASSLKEKGVDEKTVSEIFADLNTKLFQPLQDQLRQVKTDKAQPEIIHPTATHVSSAIKMPVEPSSKAVGALSELHVTNERTRISGISTPNVAVRTMAKDMEHVKAGEWPEKNSIPQGPPSEQKIATTPQPMPEITREALPHVRMTPPTAPAEPPSGQPLKSYGVDPYREPVDDGR
jgi:hypothetical protein